MTDELRIRIRRPDDFHVHLRQGDMLRDVLPATAWVYGRALVMPNTLPPVLTGDDAAAYKATILALAGKIGATHFEPLMTIKIVASTTPDTIRDAKAKGVIAGKLYPEGVTTNSEDGVRDLKSLYPIFAQMQTEQMVLCLHGEQPGAFCMDREKLFLRTLFDIARDFDKLRIVLEHVTTSAAVEAVLSLDDNVAATITPHHLLLTLDDVVGDKLRPHHFCKPIPKTPADRRDLCRAATSSGGRFFLGTDSAPHARDQKECASGCAGVFCAPVAMEVLASVFESKGSLHTLERFTSLTGASFYGLPPNDSYVNLVKSKTAVPEYVAGVAPMCAGETIGWRCEVE